MLNIIGGSKKRAKLNVPIINVRPTSSKKREAIFSIIESKNLKNKSDIYSNGYFLDLFAGSGSLGLEAISRGAKYCYFYDIAKEVIETLESNCLKICEYNNYKIIKKDITKSFFEEIDNPLSVIFIDPPYALAPFENILHNLLKANLILKNTIIIIESEKKTKINFPYLIKIIDERYYGKTRITFLCLID